MNGWIKLHRKVATNDIFNHDLTAWHLFEVLLINARDGKWSGGRKQLANLSCLKESTCYKALQRLKNAKMVTTSVTGRYTIISIVKWSNYQEASNSSSNISVTSREHSLKNKNKEYKDIKSSYKSVTRTKSDLVKLSDYLRGGDV